MDVSLSYHILRVTEEAAVQSAYWRGKGDKNAADQAATEAMRNLLNTLPVSATVVIGEGEMDEAPMLYINEKLGTGGEKIDIAVDPLDGTTLTAKNRENAITVISVAESGCLLNAPDMYMMKIGVGPKAKGSLDLSKSLTVNLNQIAEALKKKPEEINIVMLDRDRHQSYVNEARKFGARVTLITDGDVSPVIGAGIEDIDMDILFGIGGAPEGVLAACAAKCLGGDFQGKLWAENEAEVKRCQNMGIKDLNQVIKLDDMVKTDKVIFSLTGVTDGFLAKGVRLLDKKAVTESIVMNAIEKKLRKVQTVHTR
ncbi:MAG TPA: class II fructose-bisphosphatase [Spirochaetia bacterium]|nr:MAG: fructose-bisphosphatase, class II [Spirochaetes bacterium GWB1_36_13]HCL55439.1 class II fructose-bisphosphatase [Spirochaetia bacterium]